VGGGREGYFGGGIRRGGGEPCAARPVNGGHSQNFSNGGRKGVKE